MKDIKPISLVGGLYKLLAKVLAKLLAKVLANLLKTIVGEVVSDTQHDFIQGRQILDVLLIASEAINSKLKGNIPSLFLKMDIEKAYDHVN